jgi:hypothetical protein
MRGGQLLSSRESRWYAQPSRFDRPYCERQRLDVLCGGIRNWHPPLLNPIFDLRDFAGGPPGTLGLSAFVLKVDLYGILELIKAQLSQALGAKDSLTDIE